MFDRSWLEEMDRARYEDPAGTLERLITRRLEVQPRYQALFFGVCGSTLRVLAGRSAKIEQQLNQAKIHIAFGLWIARKRSDGLAAADLLLRQSYVCADRGEVGAALIDAERANAIFERCRSRPGRGQSLVDQGRYLYYLERTDEAIEAFDQALALLPETAMKFVFTAHQSLGFCFLRTGEYRAALEHCRLAESMIPSRWFEGKLRWLEARVHEASSDLAAAEVSLGLVFEIFRKLHLGEAALAAVELIRIQILQGKANLASATCQQVTSLIIPLGANRVVAAALVELLRGELTLGRVQAVKIRIEEAREHREWHSLAIGS